MLKVRCGCGGFLESNRMIIRTGEILFCCFKCGRVDFIKNGELGKLVDLDATLEHELNKKEVRNLAVFGVHYH